MTCEISKNALSEINMVNKIDQHLHCKKKEKKRKRLDIFSYLNWSCLQFSKSMRPRELSHWWFNHWSLDWPFSMLPSVCASLECLMIHYLWAMVVFNLWVLRGLLTSFRNVVYLNSTFNLCYQGRSSKV